MSTLKSLWFYFIFKTFENCIQDNVMPIKALLLVTWTQCLFKTFCEDQTEAHTHPLAKDDHHQTGADCSRHHQIAGLHSDLVSGRVNHLKSVRKIEREKKRGRYARERQPGQTSNTLMRGSACACVASCTFAQLFPQTSHLDITIGEACGVFARQLASI